MKKYFEANKIKKYKPSLDQLQKLNLNGDLWSLPKQSFPIKKDPILLPEIHRISHNIPIESLSNNSSILTKQLNPK